MKKLLTGLMILLAVLIAAPMAMADSVKMGDWIIIDREMGNYSGGGTFTVDKVGDSAGVLFDTFCLERTESWTSPVYVGGVSTGAIAGGLAGGNPDPISSQTGWLYKEWRTGAIAHTAANANAVQWAIWYFEDEFYHWDHLSAVAGAQAMVDLAIANAEEGKLYGAGVLNLYLLDDNGRPTILKQDMLVLVPEPGTLLLLGLGLLGLGFIKKGRKI